MLLFERINKHVPTARKMHILFYEQTVHGWGQRMEKGLLNDEQ